MKKVNVLWIILGLIFLVIFNVIFFVVGGVEHIASVWLSYAFIHFSYFMLVITPLLVRKGKSTAVFGFSLYLISSIYFFIALITGVIFILVSPESYRVPLLVQLIIAGLYGVLLVSNMIANEHTGDAEEVRQTQLAYVKDASLKLKLLLGRVDDKETKEKVESVYDAVHSSSIKTHPSLSHLESSIYHSINQLENAILSGNKEAIMSTADYLLAMVNERNARLKAQNE